MDFKEPFKLYRAASNIDAHLIVTMLSARGIEAFAEMDDSGASLSAFGQINQFHQPSIWVEKTSAKEAGDLIARFEETRRKRENPVRTVFHIEVECEDCGEVTTFPYSLKGTTQECPRCDAYIDVEESDANEDPIRPGEDCL